MNPDLTLPQLTVLDSSMAYRVEGLGRTAIRKLTDEEMAAYRAPFPTPKSRLPVWRFPNEPIAGEPADVGATLEHAFEALRASAYPKLFFAADPGATVPPAYATALAASLQNCRLVQLGAGTHNLQEDYPDAIGRSVAAWIRETMSGVKHDASTDLH